MFTKLFLGLSLLTCSAISYAEEIQEDPIQTELRDPTDKCYFNADQFNFNGIFVDHDQSTSYVYGSNIIYYNHKGEAKEPDSMYKGDLKESDEDGDTYEICIKKNANVYKLEETHNK